MSAKLLNQGLADSDNASSFAGDLGLQWRPGPGNLGLGLSLLNLGGSLDGAKLPTTGYLGAFTNLSLQGQPLALAADLVQGSQDASPTFSLGAESWLNGMLALRAGYQFAGALLPSGFTAGFGLRYHWLQLDYAYDGRGSLGASHQLSLDLRFGGTPAASPAPLAAALPAPLPMPNQPSTLHAQVAQSVHQMLDVLDQGDTRTVAAATDQLMAQYQPVRRAIAEEMKAKSVEPSVFKGEFEEAEKSLQVMLKLDRANSYHYEALAAVEWYLGKQKQAVEALKKAYLLDPSREYLKAKIRQLGGEAP